MSSGVQVAILPATRRGTMRSRLLADGPGARPTVRLATFAALATYGVLRWSTMIRPVPSWRLLGLLALAVVLAGSGLVLSAAPLARIARPVVVVAAVLSVLAMLAIGGIPVGWVSHVRVTVTANAIGNGLQGLPGAIVPYAGINQWVRLVILLGAGVLLLDAAILLAFAPRVLGDARRAGVALPLVALAVVPCTLVRPQLPYLQGLILFGLLAAFMWAERIHSEDGGTVVAVAGLAAAGAMALAPGLDTGKPWVDYQAWAARLAPAHVDRFNWSQSYGPLNWPRDGRTVLEVKASRADYWKAEDLDVFDGREWVAGTLPGSPLPAPDQSAIARWTQTLQVTVGAMRSSDVIAAGFAAAPTHLSGTLYAGVSPGTWASSGMGPGDSYQISTYSPDPTGSQLRSVGRDYPATDLLGYLSLQVPPSVDRSTGVVEPGVEVFFAPFGSTQIGAFGPTTADPAGDLVRSPYAGAFVLARRLAARAATPYDYVQAVMRYLSTANGFGYNETPPVRRYPLESFLFADKVGYCQQFSGAMALLLRLGGIPARVAAGFTSGTYDNATRSWTVTDQDAHSWVEAWFPRYGWVRFDPTPSAAPARGGAAPEPLLAKQLGRGAAPAAPIGRHERAPATPALAGGRHAGSSLTLVLALLVLLGSATAIVGGLLLRGGRVRSPDQLVAELERALRRSGRSLEAEVTLAALEYRFRSSPDAAGYIRALRLARFAGAGARPTARERRALRAALRQGLGLLAHLRTFWALPPKVHS